MNRALLTAASALTLGLAGCQPAARIPTAQSRLDCPQEQGDLTRVSAAVDGKSCVYSADGGTQVTLRLVPVKGDASMTLATFERELTALMPANLPGAGHPGAAGASTAQAAADAAAQAEADATSGDEGPEPGQRAKADIMGVHMEGPRDGEIDHAKIDLPGIKIDAHDDKASVNIGSTVRLDADEDGATVTMLRDVRLRGQAFSRERRGVRAKFVLTRSGLPDGLTYVGYEAGGPKVGPLVVAVVKSKSKDHDDLHDSVRKLVRHNAGV